MKNFKKLVTLTSAGLLLSAFNPSTMTIFAEESSDSVETTEGTESEATTEESAESTEEYAFEVETDVINSDEEVIGTATFREDQEGLVTVELELEGLEEGEFGMHIHEVGLATAPTFEDAGSHFNPTDVEHGTDSETGPHAGDLPNLMVGEDGTVSETIEIPDVTLDPEGENTLNSTDGTTLIIHTEADDYETQPTGDAGDRQAAAVIFAPLEDSEFYEAESDQSSDEESSIDSEEAPEESSEESSE
ncbi:superoxide dismutase family protein [Aerococcaceae bacterium DSM 111021]|nr:superoxide dismutase family protein [Aerococcaceae bacterium DSM 111021]